MATMVRTCVTDSTIWGAACLPSPRTALSPPVRCTPPQSLPSPTVAYVLLSRLTLSWLLLKANPKVVDGPVSGWRDLVEISALKWNFQGLLELQGDLTQLDDVQTCSVVWCLLSSGKVICCSVLHFWSMSYGKQRYLVIGKRTLNSQRHLKDKFCSSVFFYRLVRLTFLSACMQFLKRNHARPYAKSFFRSCSTFDSVGAGPDARDENTQPIWKWRLVISYNGTQYSGLTPANHIQFLRLSSECIDIFCGSGLWTSGLNPQTWGWKVQFS